MINQGTLVQTDSAPSPESAPALSLPPLREDLAQWLAAARAKGDAVVGYAGAMGWPQFMPSSWSRFAVDFDGDGRIDLFRSTADVIGSVANYFKIFNWQTGMPTHFDVRFDTSQLDLQALLAPDILPTFSVASFVARGALPDTAGMAHNGALALVAMTSKPAGSFVTRSP